MNVIELSGRITGIFNGYSVTKVVLFIKDAAGKGHGNYPQVIFTKNERDMVHDFAVGDYVNIHATMKTQSGTADGKPGYRQFIRGLWIGKTKNRLSEVFGEELKGWYEYKNEVCIRGDVLSVRHYGSKTCTILVRPENENFNIMLTQYTDEPEKLAGKYKGRTICALGSIRTIKKEMDGKTRYHQIIVVNGADTL